MPSIVDLREKPVAEEIFLLAGWRQWADAGSVSSGLPEYLIQSSGARKIGEMRSDGFYLFQIPGTHDLVRPVVRFKQGYPESLQSQRNEFYYAGDGVRGVVIFLGDEPHLDIERYVDGLLTAARSLRVKRIIGFGGVYGELPYDKERMVSAIYSRRKMKEELNRFALNLSDYQGGASIGSYICRRAGEAGIEFVGFYAMVPSYIFSGEDPDGNSIRIETDFMAWLAVMRRVKAMLKLDFDLSELEERSARLVELMDAKIDEIDQAMPQYGVRDYLGQLAENFTENPFEPLDEIWEDQLRRLLDKFDSDES